MKFIKKKNLLDREELLYVPNLHWMYIIKHTVQFMLLIPALLILWSAALSFTGGFILGQFRVFVGYVIWTLIILSVLILVWRILLYFAAEYGVTNKRLLMKKGIIRLVAAEIPMDRIESIYCVQGLLGRLFNYGTIFISGIGGTMPVFYMVSNPFAVRRKIAGIIEKNKAFTVIHGDLPKPKPAAKPEPEAEVEPPYRYGTFVKVLPER